MAASSTTVGQEEITVAIAGSVDVGKCFGPGTLIMKYDGTVIQVEDIKIGDILMGDDSTPRTVIETHTGSSQLYKVIPKFGRAYIVNGLHTLCLMDVDNDYNLVDMSVDDFRKLHKTDQSQYQWCTSTVTFHNDFEDEPLCITTASCLPNSYKLGSIEKRQQFLNNLSSTPGMITISTQSAQLIKDIKFVIRSLGYYVIEQMDHDQDEDLIDEMLISYSKTDRCVPIKIEKHGFGQFYGFELDGNHRFLLADCSIAHNSSLIGVMISGKLDDGNGSSRLLVAKHPHEKDSGRTSDISIRDTVVDGKLVHFMDLCGHEKYFKTTIRGLTLYPDYAFVVITANKKEIPAMAVTHMRVLVCLRIPFIILLTHVDLIVGNNDMYNSITNSIKRIVGRRARFINTNKEFDLGPEELKAAETKHSASLEEYISNSRIVPVITISNKTGYYIDVVRHALKQMKPRNVWFTTELQQGSIFYIDGKFNPPGKGLVVTGLLKGQSIKVGDTVLLGPYNKKFVSVRVWSIHDNCKTAITELHHQQRGCLAIKVIEKKTKLRKYDIRSGAVIISQDGPKQNLCYEFSAQIEVLAHSTTIKKGYESVINCGVINQTARILLSSDQTLKIGDKTKVEFRFVSRPAFMEINSSFMMRDGPLKATGTVTSVRGITDDDTEVKPVRRSSIHPKKKVQPRIEVL
jgi:elongation factor 1-alpha